MNIKANELSKIAAVACIKYTVQICVTQCGVHQYQSR